MLQSAIDAMPAVGLTTLLVTAYGKPFTAAGFGNWFGDKCRAAGLPRCTAHGLRKALARRAADQGVQQQGLKALGQWSNDREVATIYVEGPIKSGWRKALGRRDRMGTGGEHCLTLADPNCLTRRLMR
jgi:hypothetical protein